MDRYPLRSFNDAQPRARSRTRWSTPRSCSSSAAPVELPNEADLEFMRSGLPRELQVKNISYHPESDSIPRFEAAPEVKKRIEQILRTHGQRVEAFLRRSCPDFVPGWTLGTTSFRSIEEQGRKLQAALEQRARAHRRRRLRRDERRADPAVLRQHSSDARPRLGDEGQLQRVDGPAPRSSGTRPRPARRVSRSTRGRSTGSTAARRRRRQALPDRAGHRLEPVRPLDAPHPQLHEGEPALPRQPRRLSGDPFSAAVGVDGVHGRHQPLGAHGPACARHDGADSARERRIPELAPYHVLARSAA